MGNKDRHRPDVAGQAPRQSITPVEQTGVFFSPSDTEPDAERGTGFDANAEETAALASLFDSAALWRGNTLRAGDGPVCATGYPALDAHLPGGGWPVAGLTELLSGTTGVGELRLLLPALAVLAARKPGWIVWIAPPYLPNAPALLQWGLSPGRMLLIHPRSAADAAWAAEQALESGTCVAVLLWTNTLESGRAFRPASQRRTAGLSMQQFSRRLQLAAVSNQCWAVTLRAATARRQPSAAMLRLYIDSAAGQRDLHLLKVRGGQPAVVRDFDAGIDVGAAMVNDRCSGEPAVARPVNDAD